MAQDPLGPVTRALVGVPKNRLRLVADVANRLADKKVGGDWHKKLSACIQEGLPAQMSKASLPQPHSLLRRLTPDLIIPAVDGIEDLDDPKVFTGGVDPDLKRYNCNGKSGAKLATTVDVYELIEDGDFQRIFGGQGVDLDQLCLTPHQIKLFVINHREHLHPQGYATFFLLPSSLVAYVFWLDARLLEVHVHRLAHAFVWYAGPRHRVVLPQLTL